MLWIVVVLPLAILFSGCSSLPGIPDLGMIGKAVAIVGLVGTAAYFSTTITAVVSVAGAIACFYFAHSMVTKFTDLSREALNDGKVTVGEAIVLTFNACVVIPMTLAVALYGYSLSNYSMMALQRIGKS